MVLPPGPAPPPAHPPSDIVQELTLKGQIPLEYYYVDDSNKGQGSFVPPPPPPYRQRSSTHTQTGTHYKYSQEDISQLISEGKDFVAKVLSSPVPPPPHSPPHSSTWATQLTDVWLVHALNKYSSTGSSVVVFGSTSPWYEALCLAMGAGHVTTIEVMLNLRVSIQCHNISANIHAVQPPDV